MALGANVYARQGENRNATPIDRLVYPASYATDWQTVIDAGGLDAADATPITDPAAEITASDHHILIVGGRGTYLEVSAGYTKTLAFTVDPVIQVFGRASPDGRWTPVRPRSGGTAVAGATMTEDATNDVSDGTNRYTDVDSFDETFDIRGLQEILFGVKTAATGTGAASAFLQARVY